jgi:intracellular multiplication protein IcmS
MSNEIKSLTKVLLSQQSVEFTLKDRLLSLDEIVSETGLFPAIIKRADQLASLCFGYGIGVDFEDEEKSMLGMRVKFDELTPNALRYLCILDVILELIRTNKQGANKVKLDELLYD